MGGTGSVVRALEKLMTEENIKIIKNAEVTEILSDGKKVLGVKMAGSKKTYSSAERLQSTFL